MFSWIKSLFKPINRKDYMRKFYNNELCKRCMNCLTDDCVASTIPEEDGSCRNFTKAD